MIIRGLHKEENPLTSAAMKKSTSLQVACLIGALLISAAVRADDTPAITVSEAPVSLVDRATANVQNALDQALELIGVRYRRGGKSTETGFDCSGFVGHVFKEGMGLYLPNSSREISKAGEAVSKNELRPGDLVFFNTMRRTFSHVGIYLGDSLFVHSPRAGGEVRIEDLRERYWATRFNGARRIANES